MRKELFYFLFILLIFSCEREKPEAFTEPLISQTISVGTCKNFVKNQEGTLNENCVEFFYIDSTKTLFVKHVNLASNCCVDTIKPLVSVFDGAPDSLIIDELSYSLGCKCDCLYDLTYKIEGVNKGFFILKLVNRYFNNDIITIPVDLENESNGSVCVKMDRYPYQ